MPYDVFISYSSTDIAYAKEVNDRLLAEGFKVWFDRDRLQPGYDWHALIEQGCENSRVVLPVLTPRWRLSDWTKYETYGGEAIVPLLFEGTWSEVAPSPLHRFQAEILDMSRPGGPNWACLFDDIRRVRDAPLPQKSAHITHIHYRANGFFAGRERDLLQIHEELHSRPIASLTKGRVVAVCGLGGMGKTTLVRQYVEKFWRCYPQMFWIDCRMRLEGEFAQLHDLLFPERAESGLKSSDKAAAALDELNSSQSRLLILDNAGDEEAIMDWVPQTGGCHVLITSRFGGFSLAAKAMHLYVLDKEPSLEFMQKRTCIHTNKEELAACSALVEDLGYLPLAMEQAAAFIKAQGTGFGFADYLELYRENRETAIALLAERVPGGTNYPASVAATLGTAIVKMDPGSRAILRLCSFFADSPIPLNLLIGGVPLVQECAKRFAENDQLPVIGNRTLWVRRQLGLLARYSLVNVAGPVFSFHRLVQDVERLSTSEEVMRADAAVAIRLFEGFAPKESYRHPHNIIWRSLAPHAESLWRLMQESPPATWSLELPKTLALYYMDAKDSRDVTIQRKVLAEALRRHGPMYGETLLAKNDLALMLGHTNSDEAYQLYREALKGRRIVHGDVSFEVAETLANMGFLLQLTASSEVLDMLQEAVDIHTRTSGPEHWQTLSAKSTLAAVCCYRNDGQKALELCREVLADRKRVFGEESGDTLASYRDLARILSLCGKWDEAVAPCQQALSGFTACLGSEHEDTLDALQLLAELLEHTGRIEEALVLYRQHCTSLLRKPNATPLQLRVAALDGYRLGDYGLTRQLLERVLASDFEVPGTHCHLARVALLQGDVDAALHHSTEAWEHRHKAPAYVVPRCLWLLVAGAMLKDDGASVVTQLGRLKAALSAEAAIMPWYMAQVMAHLKTQLSSSELSLLSALAACRTNHKEAGRKKAPEAPFSVHVSHRKPYQAHIRAKKPQLAALCS